MDLAVIEISGDELDREKACKTAGELDLKPEYCRYKDEGCELNDSCLSCPFPRCLHEEPRGKQRWTKRVRDREISRLFDGGFNTKELSNMFDLSRRTIQRSLKKDNNRHSGESEETTGVEEVGKGDNQVNE